MGFPLGIHLAFSLLWNPGILLKTMGLSGLILILSVEVGGGKSWMFVMPQAWHYEFI